MTKPNCPSPRRTRLERIMNMYLIHFTDKEDGISYFNLCRYPEMEGILEKDRAKKCEINKCEYYRKYEVRRKNV